MSKHEVHTIQEGMTNHYVIPATVLSFLSAFLFVYIGIPAIILVIAALALFFSVSGMEIDTRQFRYRKYKVIFGLKFGRWIVFSANDSFQLWLSSESGRYLHTTYGTTPVFVAPTNFYNGNKSKIITYDLIQVLETGDKQLINDFRTYKNAKITLELFGSTGCAIRDKISEKLHENKKKRR